MTGSCAGCEGAQYSGPYDNPQPAVYVRVGTGNVKVIACKAHAQELIDRLRGKQEAAE